MQAHGRQLLWGVLTAWGCAWLALAWLLEQVRQGFVVNWINTKWLVVFVLVSGVFYLWNIICVRSNH